MAKRLGLECAIVIPDGVSEQAINNIAGEGAEITIIDGNYDEAVELAKEITSTLDNAIHIQDMSWPGYVQIPNWIIEGYTTLCTETDEQLRELGSGPALVSFVTTLDCCGGGSAGVRFVSSPSKAVTNPINRSPINSLRLDTQGTTTEKSNVVSCTPGKYTFLNGGSTAETAKVQSYIYTLLVNGKAVSTLSSDGFKTVTPHLFSTIAGNMAGTATLDGASWNLAGMSNYSASCQVYATQSGGNIQSVTTAVYDSVALAAAAEAAAAAQKAKDMIANWALTNEELAKKYRDNRLAGKP
jgi:threonine dehydratase